MLDQINVGNVGTLELAWRYDSGGATPRIAAKSNATPSSSTELSMGRRQVSLSSRSMRLRVKNCGASTPSEASTACSAPA